MAAPNLPPREDDDGARRPGEERRKYPRRPPPTRYTDAKGRLRLRGRRPSWQPHQGAKCPNGHFISDVDFLLEVHAYKCRHPVPVADWTPPAVARGAPTPKRPTRDCGLLLYVLAHFPDPVTRQPLLWATEVTPDELAYLRSEPSVLARELFLENEDPDSPRPPEPDGA